MPGQPVHAAEEWRSRAPVDAWQDKPVSVWSYASVVLRWGRLVIVLPLAGGFIAGAVSLSTPREYRASASFIEMLRIT